MDRPILRRDLSLLSVRWRHARLEWQWQPRAGELDDVRAVSRRPGARPRRRQIGQRAGVLELDHRRRPHHRGGRAFTHCRRPPTRTSRKSTRASWLRSAACSRVATAMRSTTSPTRSPTPRPRPCSYRCRLPSFRREPPRRAAAQRSSMASPSMPTPPSMPPTDPRSSGSFGVDGDP